MDESLTRNLELICPIESSCNNTQSNTTKTTKINLCSYSRQNLLSSANSKSNEMEQSQAPHITHNNLPLTIGNKFRNQINQNTPPDVLNVNQQRYYHDVFDNFSTNTNYNKSGGSAGAGGSGGGGSSGGGATASSASSSSAVNVPIAGVASMFGASTSSVQGTSTAHTAGTANANSESNLLNSIANNSNANNENR